MECCGTHCQKLWITGNNCVLTAVYDRMSDSVDSLGPILVQLFYPSSFCGCGAADGLEIPAEEVDKSPKLPAIAVKARRIALGSSKDKEDSPSDKTSPGVTPPPTRKRRWGTTKNLTQQTKKLNVNISTDMLKEMMPELKQTSLENVTMETEDKRPSSSESSDEAEGEPQPKRKEPIITRTITQVVAREESDGGEGSSDEEGRVDREGKENNGKAASSGDDEDEKASKSSREEEDSSSSDGDSDPGEDDRKSSDGEKDEKTEEERRDEQEARERRAKETAARREEREAAKQKAKMERAKEKEKKAKETLHAKKTKLREVVRTSIDDPIRVEGRTSKPIPSRRPESNVVHVMNLVRPYTLNQLKELLGRSGQLQAQEGFWIDNIKSHCYAVFNSVEEACACRDSLHGTKWPSSNPKTLCVDFASQDEMDKHTGKAVPKPEPKPEPSPAERPKRERRVSEKDRDLAKDKGGDKARERERDRQGRPPMREWDRDRERSLSRERRRREREKRLAEQKAKEEAEEPPAKLLDDLFRKTKSTPCIYWLPLTEEQIEQRLQEQKARAQDREERRKKMEEEEKERERTAKAQEPQPPRRSGGGRRHSRSRSRSRSRGRRR